MSEPKGFGGLIFFRDEAGGGGARREFGKDVAAMTSDGRTHVDQTVRQQVPQELGQARERLLSLVSDIRPELHRYCSRLLGSVVEGEDAVQETLARALYALSLSTELPPLRPWLFKVAHNTSVDLLKRYERQHVEPLGGAVEVLEGAVGPGDPEVVRAALSSFVALPVRQRSAVILKDVLGHSLEEIAETLDTTVPAVKAALVRGREAVRVASTSEETASGGGGAPIGQEERARLQRYVSLFNARDWDGLKALLTEECRLDLVSKAARRGKEVHGYFGRYAAEPDVRVELGAVEGRPALLVFSGHAGAPAYFIFLEWSGDKVAAIRDYRYVPYIAREASLETT